ncbi:MAG: mechanosensitive ion channel [Burkholderiales bacterium]|nr:mechanosensitive ion channel [Burkholderiales bacterium]
MLELITSTPLYDFISEFEQNGGTQTSLLLQAGTIVLCGVVGWLVSRLLRPRLKGAGIRQWRFGSEGMTRVIFPLVSWLGVDMAGHLWRLAHNISLLRLASSLWFALVVVRSAVYLLQAVFVQAEWVKRFERWIASAIWVLFALHITGILPDILSALDDIVFPLGKQHVSLLTVINAALSVVVTLLVALWLGRLFEARLMQVDSLDLSLRVVLNKIVRTLLVVLGVMVALPLVGIDLTVLSVFSGALGVGLGFGLQKIASSYVSGFIILLDGSIRIGDVVSIENRQGSISRITSRYVVLKLGDGTEAIIPNETLITSTVLNLSHSDELLRVALSIPVDYATDLELANKILLDATLDEPRILAEPAAQVYLKTFAESGIELELGVWIKDPSAGTLGLKSSLNMKIWRAFKAQGISIPYPHRDVRLITETRLQSVEIDQNQSSSTR